MASTVTLSTIPVELVEHILSFLDPTSQEGIEALRSLSLSNQELCHLSQKILFHTIVLQRPVSTIGEDSRITRLSYAKNFYDLITGMSESDIDSPLNIPTRPQNIATYVKRIEIRDDRRMPFYSAHRSWIITDPSAVYISLFIQPPTLHPQDNIKTNPSPEEEEDKGSTPHTLGRQRDALLPNLEEVCLVGNPRGLGLPWLLLRKDMKEALGRRMGMGLLRVLELTKCNAVPFDLLAGSVNLEVLRLHSVVFAPFIKTLSSPVDSSQGVVGGHGSKLRILDVDIGSTLFYPSKSFFGWLLRQKDTFDLSALQELVIKTAGCDAYELDNGTIVEKACSMIGMDEIAHVVERARSSLRVLHLRDPRLDFWLCDNPPFKTPSKLFEWAPHLTSITLELHGNPLETLSEETDISLLRHVSTFIGALVGLEREKPLDVELRFTFGTFSVLRRVTSAWEELEQTIRLMQSGVKPAMDIHISVE